MKYISLLKSDTCIAEVVCVVFKSSEPTTIMVKNRSLRKSIVFLGFEAFYQSIMDIQEHSKETLQDGLESDLDCKDESDEEKNEEETKLEECSSDTTAEPNK